MMADKSELNKGATVNNDEHFASAADGASQVDQKTIQDMVKATDNPDGIRRIENITRSWNRRALAGAYLTYVKIREKEAKLLFEAIC